MKEQFGEWTIEYVESLEEFKATDKEGNVISRSNSLKALKERLGKEKTTKYPRVPVWKRDFGRGFKKFEITSIAENSYNHNQVWVVDEKKKRSKETASYFCLDNIVNLKKISEINLLIREKEKIDETIEKIEDALEKFDITTYKPIEAIK